MTNNSWLDWNHLLNTYSNVVTKENLVIEIGSSTVSRTIDIAKRCKKLIGVEKYKNRIPADNKFSRYKIKIIKGDWQNLGEVITPNSIDIIIASHVIEHVKDDIKCLNESYKVLKEGGYLIFNTPNRKRLARTIIEFFIGERKFPFWEHIREYVKSDLEKLIEKSNFSDKEAVISSVGFGLRLFGFGYYTTRSPVILDSLSTFWEVVLRK
ncbi:MAG: methyltransferase type 11 [Candidatus Gottesmanbacteria bacterium GW2011_GWA2_43_14]|uniref:Methyltransferase type 11 n=1 Tax=Candidatus Gottesmanbacteria bacterium GW2011_GWA2_43_14 TaxID=1618443 RepID=A0A0G1DEQ5_9BACT|nr:MAG: methyltransferase type 11 [Candidatus Gottesmanbacteria bacterium GW2011_GWA2_43_14]